MSRCTWALRASTPRRASWSLGLAWSRRSSARSFSRVTSKALPVATSAWSIPMGTIILTWGTFDRTAFTRAKSGMGSSSDSPRRPP